MELIMEDLPKCIKSSSFSPKAIFSDMDSINFILETKEYLFGLRCREAAEKLGGALMGVMLMSTTCFAAGTGTSAVTQPLENLKTLIIAVIGAVGVIILAKNVMEFAQAYQQQDSSTMNSALKGIVAGVMMAGISTVLTFLGF